MYRWLAVFGVGCGLYTDTGPPADEPSTTSYVEYRNVPVLDWRRPIDLVFVVDTTPDMAPLHAKLVAQFAKLAAAIERYGHARDLQIMMITADPADHGALVRGAALHVLSIPAGGFERSFSGSLADELTALVPSTFTADTSQPLATLVEALGHEPAFRHGDARLLTVIVTNHDDASPDPVDSYAARIHELTGAWPLQPTLAIVETPPSPRLEQLLYSSSLEPTYQGNITDDDWSQAVASPDPWMPVASPCLDASLVEPHECVFSAVRDGSERVLPTCDVNASNRPCYELLPNLDCELGSHLYVNVNWLAWPEYRTHVIGQCVAESPSN